jgi:hypothetical protein
VSLDLKRLPGSRVLIAVTAFPAEKGSVEADALSSRTPACQPEVAGSSPVAPVKSRADFAAEFEFGLDVILDGLDRLPDERL